MEQVQNRCKSTKKKQRKQDNIDLIDFKELEEATKELDKVLKQAIKNIDTVTEVARF